jgi:membrane-bound metal-dependent hydrolase YbcI (DUF457 family)
VDDFSSKIHWGFTLIVWCMIQVQVNDVFLNPIPLLIGSLFPDTDIKYSKLGKFIPLWLLFNHRGFTHTLPAMVLFSLPIGMFYSWKWCALFACGYLLHLAMDSSTPMGIKWITGHKRRKTYAR